MSGEGDNSRARRVFESIEKEIGVMDEDMKTLVSELRDARALCSRRTARLQILRETMSDVQWNIALCRRPEMDSWFDEDGVPR